MFKKEDKVKLHSVERFSPNEEFRCVFFTGLFEQSIIEQKLLNLGRRIFSVWRFSAAAKNQHDRRVHRLCTASREIRWVSRDFLWITREIMSSSREIGGSSRDIL